MIWIWIIVGIIITIWGIKIIWAYVQASSNSSANSGGGNLNITKANGFDVTLEWGNGPVTNGNFTIYKKRTFGLFSYWRVAKVLPGNGYTGGNYTLSVEMHGVWQFKVEGDGGYIFGIIQRSI